MVVIANLPPATSNPCYKFTPRKKNHRRTVIWVKFFMYKKIEKKWKFNPTKMLNKELVLLVCRENIHRNQQEGSLNDTSYMHANYFNFAVLRRAHTHNTDEWEWEMLYLVCMLQCYDAEPCILRAGALCRPILRARSCATSTFVVVTVIRQTLERER